MPRPTSPTSSPRRSAQLLAIRGDESKGSDETRMGKLVEIVPGCRTLAIAADHRVSQDNPEALAAAVDAFIRDAG